MAPAPSRSLLAFGFLALVPATVFLAIALIGHYASESLFQALLEALVLVPEPVVMLAVVGGPVVCMITGAVLAARYRPRKGAVSLALCAGALLVGIFTLAR